MAYSPLPDEGNQHILNVVAEKQSSHRLQCEDLSYWVRGGGPQLLDRVSVSFEPGSLTAVMGSSGAGKTTLLNAVCGRASGTQKGRVLLDGKPLTSNRATLKQMFSFIPQDDILLSSLTPRETLMYTAKLRLKGTNADRRQRVEELMALLSLTSCADVQVGSVISRGLSGGQRKRCSIALELLSRPLILFVDEPTSGLDSHTAEHVVNILRGLAKTGLTVVTILHQPSFLMLSEFDQLVLIHKQAGLGCLVFSGTIPESIAYFQTLGYPVAEYVNPAEHFMRVLHTHGSGKDDDAFVDFREGWRQYDDSAKQNEERYTSEEQAGEVEAGAFTTSFVSQFCTLLLRGLRIVLKDKKQFTARILISIFIGVVFGVVYFQVEDNQFSISDREAVLFNAVVFTGMNNMMSCATLFPSERAFTIREYNNGSYHLSAYYISRLLSMVVFQVLYNAIFCGILHALVGLHGSFLVLYLILVLVGSIAVVVGMTFGILASSVEMATALVPPTISPLLIFSGFLVRVENIPVYFRFIYEISFFQYGFNALAINEFKTLCFEECTELLKCPLGLGVRCGDVVLTQLGFSHNTIKTDFIALGYILVGFVVLGYLAMYYRATRKTD